MIEKSLESAVIAAIAALGLPDLEIAGYWQEASPGSVAAEETPDVKAFLAVKASPLAFETYQSARAVCSVSFALAVRAECAPTGAALAALAEPFFRKLEDWQFSLSALRSDLNVARFALAGARLEEGSAEYDQSRQIYLVKRAITLRGVAAPATNNI